MLQIVPSAGFSPPSSSDYCNDYAVDNFDLSLLPGGIEYENTFPPNNNSIQQYVSLYYDYNSPSQVFPTYDTCVAKDPSNNLIKDVIRPSFDDCNKKNEPFFYDKNNSWSSFKDIRDDFSAKSTPKNDQMTNKNGYLDMDMNMNDWDCKSDWDNIRMQSSIPSVSSSSSGCSSPDFHLCPATPPDFESIPPFDDAKQEITLNLQNLLCDDRVENNYEKKPELLRSILEKSPLNESRKLSDTCKGANDNHKLLREVLKDTSFQKKYNLRPFDIEGLGTVFQIEGKNSFDKHTLKEEVCDVNFAEGIIAPVLSKAIEQLMQDVDNTSVMLGIPRGMTPIHYLSSWYKFYLS